MKFKTAVLVSLIFFAHRPAHALEPGQILLIANSDSAASMRLAEYYCARRGVPEENILALALGKTPAESISRSDYEKLLAEPIRQRLSSGELSGKIKCLLTTYGVPFKVGPRGPIKGQEQNLKQLQALANGKTEQLQSLIAELKILGTENHSSQVGPIRKQSIMKMVKELDREVEAALSRILSVGDSGIEKRLFAKWLGLYERLYGRAKARSAAGRHPELAPVVSAAEQAGQERTIRSQAELLNRAQLQRWSVNKRIAAGYYGLLEGAAGIRGQLMRVNADIDRLIGRETNASVDSELSMVLFGDYELYRWQTNELKGRTFREGAKTLMVSRLDGPSEQIARGLIDKAISAQEKGLEGAAYIDSRGLAADNVAYSPGYFDRSLVETAGLLCKGGKMAVVQETNARLFGPGQCPRTAIYCGWYSLRKYIDAFDFVDGAVGYHIASFEAANLRDPDSKEWCAAMLKDGITATLGAVAEPYLHSCPEPRVFFGELLDGLCLVEAYYKTKPFNSWQFVLIGDPLYRPFKKPGHQGN